MQSDVLVERMHDSSRCCSRLVDENTPSAGSEQLVGPGVGMLGVFEVFTSMDTFETAGSFWLQSFGLALCLLQPRNAVILPGFGRAHSLDAVSSIRASDMLRACSGWYAEIVGI